MQISVLKNLEAKHQKTLKQLWNKEYPVSLQFETQTTFEEFLSEIEKPTHYLLLTPEQTIKGWCFTFLRDNDVWFGLLVARELQGKGWGQNLLVQAQKDHTQLNGWAVDHNLYHKNNGQPYASPMQFYLKNGFTKLPQNRLVKDSLRAVQIRWARQ